MRTAVGHGAERLGAIADQVLAAAGVGEEVEVVVGESTTTSVRAYGGEVEALTTADIAGVGVRVIVDGRQGFASAGSLESDVVDEVLREARDNMPFAEPDQHVTLARPDHMASPVLDVWDDRVLDTPLDDKVALAIDLEKMVRSGDSRISGVRTASYGDRAGASLIASTAGIRAFNASTTASVGVLAMASDGTQTQTGSGSSMARGPQGVSIAEAADEAVDRATALLGATQPLSQRVSLVLEPKMVGSLFGIIGGMFSGDRVLKGRSPFADRVGDVIAMPGLTMIDDPTDQESYGARPHDGEGLATRVNPLIVDGVLQDFLHDTVSASRSGRATTASAVRGVRSTPGVGWQALAISGAGNGTQADTDALIAGVEVGLLVRSMTGLHSGVNAVSGDFSVGAEGLMIRAGELAEPVREVTIASTLPRLLLDIAKVGSDVERLPSGISCPPMTIANVAMSGR